MTSSSPPPARPVFDPVDTSFNASADAARDDVESPSLTNGNALARFEFEPGRSKDGTKVLMVEWEEDSTTTSVRGDWEISWEGKKTVLPARDQPQTQTPDQEQPINRLYFLLGPGVTIPTAVKLQKASSITWRTNPLPAIFPPELGATARQAGKKGVLHTIWAKKRLQVLQKEIEAESKENLEGIGLEMAYTEKEWIEQNFGVLARPGSINISTNQPAMSSAFNNNGLNSPASPRSPGGGRLMDKLKGLKLGTSASDLSQAPPTDNSSSSYNPLSPESSDVALGGFGSFAALKGMPAPSTLAAKPPQQPIEQQQQQPPAPPRKIVAQRPPDSSAVTQNQRWQQTTNMASLNAFADGDVDISSTSSQRRPADEEEQEEDDLFALPMSPRSPEMTKSPFSFAAQDTIKYLKEERASS